jgi:hypothetical protein
MGKRLLSIMVPAFVFHGIIVASQSVHRHTNTQLAVIVSVCFFVAGSPANDNISLELLHTFYSCSQKKSSLQKIGTIFYTGVVLVNHK